MSDSRATPSGPSVDRFSATYSFQGRIDVPRLLADATPRGAYAVWRAGDEHQGFTFGTSGIQVTVGRDSETIEDALSRFLQDERDFLLAVARHAALDASATVTFYVSPDPIGSYVASLSPSLLQQLAARAIRLNVLVSPPQDPPAA